jgi:hypothetical protein
MIYFKAPNGDVFAYDAEADRERYGAPDLVLMTDAQVQAHLNPPAPPRNISAEIDALERQHMLPRPVRDSLLAIAEKEAAAAGLTIAQLESLNAGYRKVKALHQQIAELRTLL